MFIIESNDIFHDDIIPDDELYNDISFPAWHKVIDLTLQPHMMTGKMSGAYLLASYYESVVFKNENTLQLTDDEIDEEIYQKCRKSEYDDYMTLSDGIKTLANMLNSKLSLYYNARYTLNPYGIKIMLHKYSNAVVELKANSAYCSSDTITFNGKFKITDNGSILSDELSKAFICVGYDDYGVILFNSLGQSYGSCGYVKLSWNVFNCNFIKAVILSPI